MGWIVVLIVFVIILVAWLARKREPARTPSSSTTIAQAPPRAEPRPKKTWELLKFGHERKLRLTIKYETGNPLPGEPAIKIRDVDIYGISNRYGYFDAYCHYRSAQRTFKISRVLWARLTGETYQIPPDYVPSGWVTEGRGEWHDTAIKESVEIVHPEVPAPSPSKDIEAGYKQKEQPHGYRETAKYAVGGEIAKSYVRHDWQKQFEESIKTPFPDEWSPALPYLYKAYELENKGADQREIQEMLEKARRADSDATSFYLGRLAIIRRTQSHNSERE